MNSLISSQGSSNIQRGDRQDSAKKSSARFDIFQAIIKFEFCGLGAFSEAQKDEQKNALTLNHLKRGTLIWSRGWMIPLRTFRERA